MYQPRDRFQAQPSYGVTLGNTMLNAERIIDILRRQWPLIASTVGGTVLLVIIYLLTASPMFTATTEILIDTRQAQVAEKDSSGTNVDMLIDPGFVDSQVEILTSDDLVLSVVRSMRLYEDPEYIGSDSGIRPAIMHALAFVFGADMPPTKEQLERTTVEALKKSIKVERLLTTYVLSVSVRSLDAEKSKEITNALADAYIVGALEAKYQATKRASEWLQQRSVELRDQVTAADRAVQTFKAQNNIVGTSRGLMSEQQLSDANTQLIQAQASTAEAKARLDRIDSIPDGDLPQPTVSDALNNPVITRLRAQYLDLSTQYADWSARYGKTHQAAINLSDRMNEVRKAIQDEVKRIADSYRSDYEIAKSREASIKASVDTLVSQAGNTGQAEVRLRNLESAADTYRNLYNSFLEKLQDATQKQSFPISEARVISTAVKPDRKSSPRTVLFLIGGLVGGLCFGVGGAFGRELLSDVLRSSSDVEEELGIKCLGILPAVNAGRSGARGGRGKERRTAVSRYVVDNPFSRFAETLRNIKVSIDAAKLSREVKVIGLLSSLPQEGKTTVAANFGHLTAMTGHRTLLIDGDLHTRSLTRELAPNAKTGLLEVLRNPRELAQHIQHSKETGLDLLPSFVVSRLVNSADVLGSKAMADTLMMLRQSYDYIFIDLAPVMPVTDAKAISHLIDGVVYVVEWGQTTRSALHESIASSEAIQKKILGVVLNRANTRMLKRIEAYKGAHYNSYYVEGA